MIVAVALVIVASAAAHGPNCCSKVSGSCRSACEKLFYDTISDVETKEQRLLDVRNFCPQHLVAFWKCMNQTEEEFGEEKSWSGCCEEAQTEKCRQGCKNAVRTPDLQHHCRRGDEEALYSCVQKQERGEECCGLARTPDCHELCRRWLQEPGKVSWSSLASLCTPLVQGCLNNVSRPFFLATPQKYLHCCEYASTSECKDTCRRNLKKRMYDIEIMNNLKDACGALVLHEGEMKLAQCLLHSEPAAMTRSESSDSLGNDGAILHCCYKAVSNNCKRSCIRTFSNMTSSYSEYERNCQNSTEEDFLQCYDEVAEPCELGCKGLSYCTEFNDRPLDMFRACNVEADHAAQEDIADVEKTGYIKLLNKQKLYIKDLTYCPPEKFKALACINQIKPCDRFTQTTRICFDQCMSLMEECIDVKKPNALESAIAICKMLAPPDSSNNCINVTIAPSVMEEETEQQLSSPCRAANCGVNEICRVNRSCSSGDQCNMYTCTKGCLVGKTQNILVHERSYARAPKPGKNICHKICQCSRTGVIKHCRDSCKPLGLTNSNCKKMEHGSTWLMGCNLCSCYYSEVVCSKKLCDVATNGTTSLASRTLQCNCALHYLPVCAWNGVTYPNQCLARCLEVGGYTVGPCSALDHCSKTICQRKDDVCLPKPQVCLAFLHKNCSQHVCVSRRSDCSIYPEDPVCDTKGQTHANPCRLLKAHKELAYFGPCLANCKSEGEVCGVDGNTYKSECAAHARYISVDYEGSCSYLGSVSEEPQVQCPGVKCPPLAEPECMAITPPGACCPICAAAITVLFSQKEIDRVLLALNGQGVEQFSVEAIMNTLDREVLTADCTLRGHLTIEYSLLVLVVPSKKDAGRLVHEACIREAEKIALLIRRQSPRIVVPLSTSIFTGARLVHLPAKKQEPDSSSMSVPLPALVTFLLLINIFSYYFRL